MTRLPEPSHTPVVIEPLEGSDHGEPVGSVCDGSVHHALYLGCLQGWDPLHRPLSVRSYPIQVILKQLLTKT